MLENLSPTDLRTAADRLAAAEEETMENVGMYRDERRQLEFADAYRRTAEALRTEAVRRECARNAVVAVRPPDWLEDGGLDRLYARVRASGAAGIVVEVSAPDADRLHDAASGPLRTDRWRIQEEDVLELIVSAEDTPEWMDRLPAGADVAHRDSLDAEGYVVGEEVPGPSSVAEVRGWTVLGFPESPDRPRPALLVDGAGMDGEPVPYPLELVYVERGRGPGPRGLGLARARWRATPEERQRLSVEAAAR